MIYLDKCKHCGKDPDLTFDTQVLGHGMSVCCWYVLCSCGMRTVHQAEYNITEDQCKRIVSDIWNGEKHP